MNDVELKPLAAWSEEDTQPQETPEEPEHEGDDTDIQPTVAMAFHRLAQG